MKIKLTSVLLAGLALAALTPTMASAWSAPKRAPRPEQHVLMVGDSIAADTAPFLQDAFNEAHARVRFTSVAVPGSSLVHPDTIPAFIAALDANPGTDVVLAEYVGNCWTANSFPCPDVSQSDKAAIWTDHQRQMIDIANARGVRVAWVASPTAIREPVLNQVRDLTLEVMVERNVTMIPWADYVDASYSRDGLHLTEAGSRRVADRTAREWHTRLRSAA